MTAAAFQLAVALQLVSTLAMTGLILLVQFVHYPLFDRVAEDRFIRFETDHSNWITFIVFPLMTVELGTAIWLAIGRSGSPDRWIWYAGLALVGLLWLSTAVLSVPEHNRLMNGFDAAAHRRLVVTNWPRTLMWSLRTGLLVYVFLTMFRPTLPADVEQPPASASKPNNVSLPTS